MYRVVVMAVNAWGKAVQIVTKQKISHVWLASHTADGDVDQLPYGTSPRAPPAVRSQKPAP